MDQASLRDAGVILRRDPGVETPGYLRDVPPGPNHFCRATLPSILLCVVAGHFCRASLPGVRRAIYEGN